MSQQDDLFNDIDLDLDENPKEEKKVDTPAVQNNVPEEKVTSQKDVQEEHNVLGNLYGPVIPKQDTAYTEINEVVVNGTTPMNVKYNYPDKPKIDYELDTWNTIDNFENRVWSQKSEGIKTGFTSIDKGFDHGLHSGFIIIAGEANIGKSIVLSQMAHQIVENNDNVFVMDFSLDDAMPDKLSRVVACSNKVMINAVKNPKAYSKYPLMLARRKQGMIKLRSMINKYKPYDASFSTFIEDIEDEIIKMKVNFDNTDTQLVVCIDSFHDLNIKNSPNLQDKQKYDLLAQWCSDISIKYDIILLCTGELRKLNSTARPTPDALRESVKIKYEAKAILLAYNEVHYKGENADICFMRKGNPLKQPVLEIHFAKNKFSTYKGRIFFEMYPEMSRLEEPDDQAQKYYSSLVYGN